MKNKIIFPVMLLTLVSITTPSCFNDLDLEPAYGLNSVAVYEDPANYIHVLAKIYSV